ncbi:MAG: YdcH family protein [Betaproteobacteria bacterium]|nr:YdcH family protein [Betaproteobacteria bacterium]MBP6189930.1 YdcH family protein [Azonexus sp.]
MFHEYRDLISELKMSDRYVQALFEKHNTLDQRVKNMESRLEPGTHDEIEVLKKKKLAIKDELYGLLQKTSLNRV